MAIYFQVRTEPVQTYQHLGAFLIPRLADNGLLKSSHLTPDWTRRDRASSRKMFEIP
jgi:hypothetical protein